VQRLADALGLAATQRDELLRVSARSRRPTQLASRDQHAMDVGFDASAAGRSEYPDTLSAPPFPAQPEGRLPQHLTRLIGRDPTVRELAQIFLRPGGRLLTLTGPGGVGKTRVAVAVAEYVESGFADGVWFVDLSVLRQTGLIVPTITHVLGIKEVGGRPPLERLLISVGDRHVLLVLDNCEHLIGACAQIAERLLKECLHLSILATSREPLRVQGETAWRVMPLATPGSDGRVSAREVAECDSVQLFVERARQVVPHFSCSPANASAIAEICHRLDGIPLAIELAAARVRVLSPAQIAARLDNRFQLLSVATRTAPARHQTLRETLQWSYELLTVAERTLFHRLSAFAGGCTLEAAEDVASAIVVPDPDFLDLLTALVDRSLVLAERDESYVRYRLLETVRQFASEQLEALGETELVRNRHAAYFLRLAQERDPWLWGPDMATWQTTLERDKGNLRAALAWLMETGQVSDAQRLAAVLSRFWQLGNHCAEGREWLARLIELSQPVEAPVFARVLLGAGLIAAYQGEYATARDYLERALAMSRQVGDRLAQAHVVFSLGLLAWLGGDTPAARELADAGLTLSREGSYRLQESLNLFLLGAVAAENEDFEAAETLARATLDISTELTFTQGRGLALGILGAVSYERGEYIQAHSQLEGALELFRTAGFAVGMVWTLGFLGWLAAAEGQTALARDIFARSVDLIRSLGMSTRIPVVLEGLAEVAALEGQPIRAIGLAGAATAERIRLHTQSSRIEHGHLCRWLVPVRSNMDCADAVAAWLEGSLLPLEQAISLGLERPSTVRYVTRAVPNHCDDNSVCASRKSAWNVAATLLQQSVHDCQ
jgi:non-specific serine/threonine protein kinase